jgi:hypothetical protein
MLLNEELDYLLPGIEDLEKNMVDVTVIAPVFMIYDKTAKLIEIRPTSPNFHLGFSIVRIILSDSKISQEFKFSCQVSNTPPYFVMPIKDLKLSLNVDFTYSLPMANDRENLPVKVTATQDDGRPLPDNIIFDETEQKFQIMKTKKPGSHMIKVCLDDNFAPKKCYFFKIKFENIRVVEGSG